MLSISSAEVSEYDVVVYQRTHRFRLAKIATKRTSAVYLSLLPLFLNRTQTTDAFLPLGPAKGIEKKQCQQRKSGQGPKNENVKYY